MRTLVVGHGYMGQAHARVLRKLGTRVVTVDPRARAQYKTISAAPRAKTAIIATPAFLLADMAIEAMSRGMDVLVEKPMALDPKEAEILAAAAIDTGQKLRVGYTERFNPGLQTMRSHMHMVGTIKTVCAMRLGPAGRSTLSPALDLATHDLDALAFLGLQPRITDAVMGDRQLLADLELREGKGRLGASTRHASKVRTLTMTGTRGMLTLDYQKQALMFANGDTTLRIHVKRAEPLVQQHLGFRRGEGATAQDGINALRLATQIREGIAA